ncbi:LysM peptidoglycan-binding domain-containing protein [Clostridium bowmanii]|uniref:LysM peptidoglycan-binding domain-containing protein n=1 Tax=Clostridium bowmanii TaxID=132925 RepID=UPI001C0DAD7D|nr:LysM peptidoglycan-binding domain-containing protein [Clostridium bowmanii]MBU3189125.1 LysM peptidoglycan-binding domain-containing protein [Clostridium bowmanii]MCA1073775.1 LysM peptidoglycan-binding domain-containing protein [Clostridium bowmanii]
MKMKKGIISVSTIVVLILGVFFALRFIGGRENATNIKTPADSIVKSDNLIPEGNNEALTNEVITKKVITNENEVENIQGKSSNEMDSTYINDKTDVGIYTVKKDDTVFSIVETYMPSQDKIKVLEFIKNRNSMDEKYKIEVGQKIVIPYKKSNETSKETSKAVVADDNTSKYMIKKQDTLTSIAKNNMATYNVKQAIEMLKETNKITDENAIKEGTLIYIPK